LQGYDDAEITVVGNGEEGKFRMDVLTDEITDGESHIRRSQGFRFIGCDPSSRWGNNRTD
jgi:hypothetical protein